MHPMAESTQKTAALQFHEVRHRSCSSCGPCRCMNGKENRMGKERVTRRQKDISRLLREKKKTAKPKPLRPGKKK